MKTKKAALRPTFILLHNKSVRRSSIFTVMKTALLGSADGNQARAKQGGLTVRMVQCILMLHLLCVSEAEQSRAGGQGHNRQESSVCF